jgi:NAD(P)-dependent dehydrogenase (short-subunit alcohol dehydrogenase family)
LSGLGAHGDGGGRIRADRVAVGGDARAGEKAAMADVPIGRVLEPEEVAGLVNYLCSDIAEGMTGQALTLDGGVMA